MSWTDKELRKREAVEARDRALRSSRSSRSSGPDSRGETTRMTALWDKLEAANNALPDKLRLRRDDVKRESNSPNPPNSPNAPSFLVWLMAPNRAGLGFTGQGIRYVFPSENKRKHPNFWIWWDADKGYRLTRTPEWSWSGAKTMERRFREDAVDHMMKCLVTGARIKYRSVSRGRFWKFF